MKILLTFFLLCFSSSLFADDISDFQIEGMSIGDSLLDYFTLPEINEPNKYYFKDNRFIGIHIYKHSSFKVYDGVSFAYKPEEKYKIYELTGQIYFRDNVDECYKKQDEIVSELSVVFKNIAKKEKYNGNFPPDESGKSKTTVVQFTLSSGTVRVVCHDMSEKVTKERNWFDSLKVEIMEEEYKNFIFNEAYK